MQGIKDTIHNCFTSLQALTPHTLNTNSTRTNTMTINKTRVALWNNYDIYIEYMHVLNEHCSCLPYKLGFILKGGSLSLATLYSTWKNDNMHWEKIKFWLGPGISWRINILWNSIFFMYRSWWRRQKCPLLAFSLCEFKHDIERSLNTRR